MIKKTHEEYMAIAKVLGEHMGYELQGDSLMIVLHFILNPTCPMCLDRITENKKQAGVQ